MFTPACHEANLRVYFTNTPHSHHGVSLVAKTKSKINKAAEIRAYFAANPAAKGGDVVAALKAKGIKVSLPQVYNAKQSSGKKKKGRKNLVRTAMSKDEGVASKSLHVIEAAFVMLEHMTVDSAKAILDRLSSGKHKAK